MPKPMPRSGENRSNNDKIANIFRLRLLQTTDLHMHLLPFDYTTMQATADRGLANLVDAIADYRRDGMPTFLFDTGDFLQGNPLADAAMTEDEIDRHPMAWAFNYLGYDAVVLGNHDFDYGVDALGRVIRQIDCPVLSANVTAVRDAPAYLPSTLITVETTGTEPPLTVGIIGLTTPVVSLTTGNGGPAVATDDPVEIAAPLAAKLREDGADVVVALCHFGIDPNDHIENVAADIAAIDAVDVVMAGHTHETFPQGTAYSGPAIDADNGAIHGKPATMPGAFGAYLGVIDLEIARTAEATTITGHTARLHRPTAIARPTVCAQVKALHNSTVAALNQHVAQTLLPFSTAFSLIQPDLTQYLLACSRQLHMEVLLSNTTFDKLPILSTAAPFATGSRADPDDFISVAPGPIMRSDVTAIYPFNNAAVAILRNGAQIKDWLEASALLYRTVQVGQTNQPLIDPQIPPYRFDTIFGLTYEIDVSQAPGNRIKSIRHNGVSVADSDRFILISTTNRLEQRQNIPCEDVICISQKNSQDILVHSLGLQSPINFVCPNVWDFAHLPNTAAKFWTSRCANPHDCDRQLVDEGIDQNRFRRFTLSFDRPATLA